VDRLTFQEEIAWRQRIHAMYRAANRSRQEAGLGNRKYRDYLRGRSPWNFNERSMKMARDRKRTPQQDVAELVAQRGYREGWTPEQFIARQVAKLAAQIGELPQHVDLPGQLGPLIASTGTIARWTFDQDQTWQDGMTSCTPHALMAELAGIQVVVFRLAEELARLTGEDYDVVERALVNVAADTLRGKQ
jgi:hypothetical protein